MNYIKKIPSNIKKLSLRTKATLVILIFGLITTLTFFVYKDIIINDNQVAFEEQIPSTTFTSFSWQRNDLFILSRNEDNSFVQKMTSTGDNPPEITKSIEIEGLVGIETEDNYIIAFTKNTIYRLDNNLEIQAKKELPKVELENLDIKGIDTSNSFAQLTQKSLVLKDNHIFFSYGGDFHVYDQDLNLIGDVTLGIKKDAHDILIYNNKAYLLDNFAMPVWIFIIDLSNIKKPKIEDKVELELVNGHLTNQFVKDDTWYISESYSRMNGWGSTLYSFDLNKPLDNLEKQVLSLFHETARGEVTPDTKVEPILLDDYLVDSNFVLSYNPVSEEYQSFDAKIGIGEGELYRDLEDCQEKCV